MKKDLRKFVSKEEAEKMIEYLLIYQTETIDDFMIIEEFYNEMYVTIDETIVESIKNEQLKAAYKLLLDSALKIKFNDYYAYLETDWQSLKKFSPYLPEDYGKIFDLYIKLDNYEYDCEKVDVISLGEDIIKTESIIKLTSPGFLKQISNELYESQIYNLLLGPEGGHMYLWSDKDNIEYSELIELSKKYPKSILSKIISEIDKTNIEEIDDGTKVIRKYLTFGIESNIYIETLNYSEGGGEYEVIQIEMPDNKKKENRINNIIKMTADDYIVENKARDFYLSMDLKHANNQYISYEIYLEYTDLHGNDDCKYNYKTLDYAQEKYITLEEYLGVSFDSIKHELEEIMGGEIDFSPEFVLFPKEIHLLSYKQEGENAFLNLKDLMFWGTVPRHSRVVK